MRPGGAPSAPQTATVEVLTAEVRVLMVGARQVTLSVARQLDKVAPDKIIPFGRIRTGQAEPCDIEVIGSANGVLCRSSARRVPNVCGYDTQSAGGGRWMGGRCPEGLRLEAVKDSATWHAYRAWMVEQPGRPADPAAQQAAQNALEAHTLHTWDWFSPSEEIVTAWEQLPLIVLAGLR